MNKIKICINLRLTAKNCAVHCNDANDNVNKIQESVYVRRTLAQFISIAANTYTYIFDDDIVFLECENKSFFYDYTIL